MQVVSLPLVHLDGHRLIRHSGSHHLHEGRVDRDISQSGSGPRTGKIEILAEVTVHDLVANAFAGRYGATSPASPPSCGSRSTSGALGGSVGCSATARRYVRLRPIRVEKKRGSRSCVLIRPRVTAVVDNIIL